MSYSFLDFGKFADAFAAEIDLLAESERWRSYENRDFFKDNIGDIMSSISLSIVTVETWGRMVHGALQAEIEYGLK